MVAEVSVPFFHFIFSHWLPANNFLKFLVPKWVGSEIPVSLNLFLSVHQFYHIETEINFAKFIYCLERFSGFFRISYVQDTVHRCVFTFFFFNLDIVYIIFFSNCPGRTSSKILYRKKWQEQKSYLVSYCRENISSHSLSSVRLTTGVFVDAHY